MLSRLLRPLLQQDAQPWLHEPVSAQMPQSNSSPDIPSDRHTYNINTHRRSNTNANPNAQRSAYASPDALALAAWQSRADRHTRADAATTSYSKPNSANRHAISQDATMRLPGSASVLHTGAMSATAVRLLCTGAADGGMPGHVSGAQPTELCSAAATAV